MEDLFAKATRDKVKFVTVKGEISIEDLWDLPLTSEKGFDLDSINLLKNHNRFLPHF